MKKAVLLIAALVVLSAFAFAEVKLGAWGRGIFVPAIGADGDIRSALMASWGPSGVRIGTTISGTSDNVGFQLDIKGDNGDVVAGDQQKIWVKPISMLTVQVGRIFDDTLRGNACFGAWDYLRYSTIDGEDSIFMRVGQGGGGPQANFELSLAPTEGAYIFLALGQNNLMTPGMTAEKMLNYSQLGAGYTIEGIGLARIQYIARADLSVGAGIINGAFKLTAVEKLTADLGVFVPSMFDDPEMGNLMAKISLYANYAMDALTLHLYGDVSLFGEDHVGDDLGFTIAGGLDYNLEGGISINADIRYKNDIAAGVPSTPWEDGTISGMLGVKMGFSNGLIGIAVEVTTGAFADWTGNLLDKTEYDAIAWAIPIRLEYWF